MKAIRFWFILIRNAKHWYNTQINRVKYQKTTDSRYCSPYTPLVTYNILCSYSSYSREHMSSSYTFSCQFSRRLGRVCHIGCDTTTRCWGKICISGLVGSGFWRLLFLARWNWLQRRVCICCFTKTSGLYHNSGTLQFSLSF